ncbi:alpha/beta fold hydrolase [Rhizobium sp. A37_96]
MTEGYCKVAPNIALHYRLEGAGSEPLICIHGVGGSLDAWEGVARFLHDDFRILRMDLRGHGLSTKVRGRYEIDDFVNDVLALADEAGFSSFNLAGYSLGGLIAQRMALLRPERVRRLCLLSTVANRNSEERVRVLERLDALKTSERGAHFDASAARWFSDAFRRANPALMTRLRDQYASNDAECYAAAYRVLAETDFGGLLDQIASPTLIATGEGDQGSNPRMARSMHEAIPGSSLTILRGLRHSVLIEAPETVGGLLSGFIRGGIAPESIG